MISHTIKNLRAIPVVIPLARPMRTASGNVDTAPLVLIDVEASDGTVGSAYIFCARPTFLPALAKSVDLLGDHIIGKPYDAAAITKPLEKMFLLLGVQGLVGMAISGVDMALWDGMGKLEGKPIVELLGGTAQPFKTYDSYGMVDPTDDKRSLEKSVADGFPGIKIKIGGGTLDDDIANVAAIRKIIGDDVALMVDYNQSLTPAQTITRAKALEPFNLAWIEEPVPADDLLGHAEIRENINIPLQTGENWWFAKGMVNALALRACDLAMPDMMKIGGITGWLEAVTFPHAEPVPVSSHLFHEHSIHTMCLTPQPDWIELVEFAGGVLKDPPLPKDGMMHPHGPGAAIYWDEDAVKKFRVDQ